MPACLVTWRSAWVFSLMGGMLVGGSAVAAEPVDLPLQATVQLDACAPCAADGGAVRVDVPLELRLPGPPSTGVPLVLIDGVGARVPFALADASPADEPVRLRIQPGEGMDGLQVDAPDRPIDLLKFDVAGDRPTAATVTVRALDTGATIAQGLLWTWGGSGRDTLALPSVQTALLVELHWHGPRPRRPVGLTAWRSAEAMLPPHRVDLEVGPTVLTENGTARTTLILPRPMPVSAIQLEVDGDIIDRRVTLSTLPSPIEGERTLGEGRLRRLKMGSTVIDDATIPLSSMPDGEMLVVEVDASAGPVLEVVGATAIVPAQALWVRSENRGDLTLLGGAVGMESPQSELQVALPELVSSTLGVAPTTAVTANPQWVPPEEQSGLAAPGALLENSNVYTHSAPVEGPVGLVRIPLSIEVMRILGERIGDIRLVVEGPEGTLQQIPHLRRRLPVDVPLLGLEMERVEDNGRSRIVLHNPEPGLPLTALTLTTDATIFARTVSVMRPMEGYLQPLRMVNWVGSERPTSMTVSLPSVAGKELVVEIDNGDDPPLPILGADAQWAAWEILAVLPEGGATLLFGGQSNAMADHDLYLLEAELGRRATALATLGPPEPREPPPLGRPDLIALWVGLIALVAGLLVLVLRLVRGLPEPEATEE